MSSHTVKSVRFASSTSVSSLEPTTTAANSTILEKVGLDAEVLPTYNESKADVLIDSGVPSNWIGGQAADKGAMPQKQEVEQKIKFNFVLEGAKDKDEKDKEEKSHEWNAAAAAELENVYSVLVTPGAEIPDVEDFEGSDEDKHSEYDLDALDEIPSLMSPRAYERFYLDQCFGSPVDLHYANQKLIDWLECLPYADFVERTFVDVLETKNPSEGDNEFDDDDKASVIGILSPRSFESHCQTPEVNLEYANDKLEMWLDSLDKAEYQARTGGGAY